MPIFYLRFLICDFLLAIFYFAFLMLHKHNSNWKSQITNDKYQTTTVRLDLP